MEFAWECFGMGIDLFLLLVLLTWAFGFCLWRLKVVSGLERLD
jgi:hypothetical protein